MKIKYEYSDPIEKYKKDFDNLENFLRLHPLYESFLSEGREKHPQTITVQVDDYPFFERITVIP